MNTDTGHLIKLDPEQDPPAGYTKVPKRLSCIANRLLDASPEIQIDLATRSPLSDWANAHKAGRLLKDAGYRAKKARKKACNARANAAHNPPKPDSKRSLRKQKENGDQL